MSEENRSSERLSSASENQSEQPQRRRRRKFVRIYEPPTMEPASTWDNIKLLSMFVIPLAVILAWGFTG